MIAVAMESKGAADSLSASMAMKKVCRGPAAESRMTAPSPPMAMMSAVVVEVTDRIRTPASARLCSVASGSVDRPTQVESVGKITVATVTASTA